MTRAPEAPRRRYNWSDHRGPRGVVSEELYQMTAQGSDTIASPGNLAPAGKMSHLRWVICSLLFLATVIAYVDRGVIAYLEKFLEGVIPGLNSIKYGYILAAFQGGLRHRHGGGRRAHRQARHAKSFRHRHLPVERRSHAAGPGIFGHHIRRSHVSSRAGRGGELSCLHQNRG